MLRGMASRRFERAGAALMPVAARRRVARVVVKCMVMSWGWVVGELELLWWMRVKIGGDGGLLILVH